VVRKFLKAMVLTLEKNAVQTGVVSSV